MNSESFCSIFFFFLLLFSLIDVFIRPLFDANGTFMYGKGTKDRQQYLDIFCTSRGGSCIS